MSDGFVRVDQSKVDRVIRGREIQRRRIALGIHSIDGLRRRTGISRNALTNAEAGLASESTYTRLEAWLAKHEANPGVPPLRFDANPRSHQDIELSATVDHNGSQVTITAAGPAGSGDELARVVAAAVQILRDPTIDVRRLHTNGDHK